MAVVSGGTTLIDNGALDAAVPTGSLTLLSTQTASSSANLSFTSGIDSTYDSYVFKFINIHSSADANLEFNGSTDSGSNYNVTKTTTFFRAYHGEDDSTGLSYETDKDLAQSTSFQRISHSQYTDNDSSSVGILHLFNPSSTTFAKNFISNCQWMQNALSMNGYCGGYMNTTLAVDAVRFQMSSGNIDSGTIKMYGVK